MSMIIIIFFQQCILSPILREQNNETVRKAECGRDGHRPGYAFQADDEVQ